MNPQIQAIYDANIRRYKCDRGHPCVKFSFDILREREPDKYNHIGEQIENLEWGQSSNQKKIQHRSLMFRKYISLFGFRPVKIPESYDLCFMGGKADGQVYHCGLFIDGYIVHLNPTNNSLAVDKPETLIIMLYARK